MNAVVDRVKNGEGTDIATLLRSRLKLPGSLESLRARYADAKPFPHLVLDNLFPDEILDAVVAESPQLNRDNWLFIEADGLQQVLRMRTSVDMGPASYQLAAFVHSPAFLYLLSELTGVWQLLPDPYLQGAGHAAMRRGMFMEVHSDRNIAYDTGLTRRLAMSSRASSKQPAASPPGESTSNTISSTSSSSSAKLRAKTLTRRWPRTPNSWP